MRTRIAKMIQFPGEALPTTGSGKTQRSDKIHPYLKSSFWNQPRNRFWECASHTQASKDYLNSLHPISL